LRDLWNKGKWKADIPTIQSTLRKGEALEGDFFKKEPEWIDFEEGFVVERREVDEIIKKLENDNIQLVLGEPASGKSVILKHIGFKLAKENKDVYVVELKKHSKDEIKRYFDDIFKIKDGKAVFIVDDAHLLPSECERLVREFKNRKLKAKLIIGSRPTREIRGEHPKEASVFEYLNKTDIHAEDVTEEIIKTFLKRKYGFSDERIERVSKNLEEYKKDLWHLSWALKAYNPEKDSMEEKEIYERVKDSIRDINAEDVFLSLSIFYRFEIPIERYFLEEQLGIEEDKINQLIELSEIIETEEEYRMLSLNHSSIAELYFKTYQLYRDLGRRITKKILNQRDEDLECCLFYKYMTSTHTKNAVDIVIHLGGDWLNEKGGIALQKKLIDDKKIQRSIKEGVEKEEDIGKIGFCVVFIALANEKVAREIVNCINMDTLSSKIEQEEDIEKIGSSVFYIAYVSEEVAQEIVSHINIDGILSKIEKEEDIEKIGRCVEVIARAKKEVSQEIAIRLNPELREKLLERKQL
jgi:energy-coupling factor transporter ATP-binding protein EcfA2